MSVCEPIRAKTFASTVERETFMSRVCEWMTHDYGARIDPYIKWARNPPAILAMAMASAVLCGLYLHPRGLILASGLWAVLVFGMIWPWVSVRGLSGSMTFGRVRVREGEAVETVLLVRNRMPWSAWGLAVRGTGLDDSAGTVAGIAAVRGWFTVEARRDLIPERRGEYPIEAPRISSAFPFGLRQASRPLSVTAPLLVWPRTFAVGPIPEAAGGREGDGPSPRDKAGVAGDLLGVRPYRRGDSLRRVHWPQSARYGHLIVCELESRATPRIQIVLDIAPDAHVGSGPDGSLEWAVRIAASFAEDWIGQGAEVELVYGYRAVASQSGPVASRRGRVLDAVARLRPDDRFALGEVLDGPACRKFSGGLRVVVTTDRGVAGLRERSGRDRGERFVVLKSSAFSGPERVAPVGVSPIRPWIEIDDASVVPGLVRRGWKEVAVAN